MHLKAYFYNLSHASYYYFLLCIADLPPTALNVNVTCSSVVNMTTRSYDITVHFFIDATFTVSRVAAIESISTTIAEVGSSGIVVLSNFRREVFPFHGIEKGPGNVTLMFPNKMPLTNNQSFYSVQVNSKIRIAGNKYVYTLDYSDRQDSSI